MANVFQNNKYNPTYWAQEGLFHLQETLGMAKRVYWGYSDERQMGSRNLGETVTVTIPGLLTATNDPNRDPEDLLTSSRSITLNTYTKSDFQVTDQEMAYGGDSTIGDHIRQAIYAVVKDIDHKLVALASRIPYRIAADTDVTNDLINGRTTLFENGVPVDREPVHYIIDPITYAALLKSGIYSSANIAGAAANTALMRGSLDERFGVMPFPMQTASITHTTGTIATQGSAETAALVGAHTVGSTSLSLDGATNALTIKAGDPLIIAGNSQKYIASANATVSGTGTVTLSVWPPLVTNYVNDAVVTFDETAVAGGTYTGLAMFNSKAFAIVPAPLPTAGADIGSVRMSTATDPETGLSVRATMSYNASGVGKVVVKYDALFGMDLIDPNRAVMICRA